ncbi:MAG: DUF308 domain-containing protein [Bradyrhizobium sp.]|uniref:DUF308 domain-containing protein n=1 Tax=Bradyrhizobium sp. TaxID=376 RepID=UPI001C2949CC|nr:DUF308 domain-containing protein [Bradyrhizobium sp.]MBU6462333.1 DUF308 domain-containing protein [Pseudomonadota bacterium]MDE2067385.1 DUF308 domain-containing protein [Bradyrhizobium sp.]MDE2470020.1 DUF308 domain-containing protein [Bradyrhizobium sp.]
MIVALLIAGVGFLLAGLLGVAYGIPIKEFSFGNTMIIAGAIMACTGTMMIALYVVVRELKAVAEHLEMSVAITPRSAFRAPPAGVDAMPDDRSFDDNDLPLNQTGAVNPAGAESGAVPSAPPPWHEETAARERSRNAPLPLPAEAVPAPKQRRNLLFSSTSRRERERAEARGPETSAAKPPAAKPGELQPATFEEAWPQSEDAKATDAPPRRSGRAPSNLAELKAGAGRAIPAARREEAAAVTVLKSGVVDGMAYTLYSDGSIEAQLPEGMMRFASIDALRAHLDQRA